MKVTILLLLLVITLGGCGWGTVHPGERAVFAHWGSLDRWPGCFKEGLYFYNPFTTDMWELDVKVQKLEVKKMTAASRDLQDVHADIVLNFAIDGDKCHLLVKEVGTDFKDRVILPAVSEVLKQATAHFPIAEIIQQRAKLRAEILDGLRGRLTQYHIIVHDVALTDFGFSRSFSEAIEKKQVEEQNVQRKEYERQQAEKVASAAVATARGLADSNLLVAAADAQGNLLKAKATAEGNRLIRESLTSELIQFKTVQAWNGQLPQLMGSGVVPFLNLDMSERKTRPSSGGGGPTIQKQSTIERIDPVTGERSEALYMHYGVSLRP